ncbi:MAG: glycerol kinase, partial [Cyanobacteriota bacterium]
WSDYQQLVSDRQVEKIEPGIGQAQAQENFAMWSKAVDRAKNWIE